MISQLLDLFTPKWKNSDVKVRLSAVRALQDGPLLAKILQEDPAEEVQWEALVNILNPMQQLGQLLVMVPLLEKYHTEQIFHRKMQGHFAEKILSLLLKLPQSTWSDLSSRPEVQVWVMHLNDESHLLKLLEHTPTSALIHLVLPRLQSPKALVKLSKMALGMEAGLQIVESLASKGQGEALFKLSQEASNKKVRQLAKQKWDELNPQAKSTPNVAPNINTNTNTNVSTVEVATSVSPTNFTETSSPHHRSLAQRSQEELDKFLIPLKKMAQNPEQQNILPQEEYEKQWLSLTHHKENLSPAANKTNEQIFADSLQALEKWQLKKRTSSNEHQQKWRRLQQILHKWQKWQQENYWRGVKYKDFSVQVQEDRAQWTQQQQIDTQLLSEEQLGQRAILFNILEQLENEERQWRQQQEQKNLMRANCEKELQEMLTAAEHLLARLREQAASSQTSHSSQNSHLDMRELKNTVGQWRQDWKEKGEQVPKLKRELSPRFQGTLANISEFFQQHREERDWQIWSNTKLLQQLIQEAQQIAGREDVMGLAHDLKDLNQKWKQVFPIPRKVLDELSPQFYTHIKLGQERCRQRKEEFLNEVQTLLAPLQEIATITPEIVQQMQLLDVKQKIISLQKEWNNIGILPAILENPLVQPFREHCQNFFEKMKSFHAIKEKEGEENYFTKQNIFHECKKLHARCQVHPDELFTIHEKVKELQQQWKRTGAIPKEKGDELWQNFRQITQDIYDQVQAKMQENLLVKQEILAQVLGITSPLTATSASSAQEISKDLLQTAQQQMLALQEKWQQLGPAPYQQEMAIKQELEQQSRMLETLLTQQEKSAQQTLDAHEEQKEKIVRHVEELCGNSCLQIESAGETLAKLHEQKELWAKIGSTHAKKEKELNRRLLLASQAFEREYHLLQNVTTTQLEISLLENLQAKEHICLSLDVLARLLLPQAPLPEIPQVERAEQFRLAQNFKGQLFVKDDHQLTRNNVLKKVFELQEEWIKLGGVPLPAREQLWSKYRHLVQLFF